MVARLALARADNPAAPVVGGDFFHAHPPFLTSSVIAADGTRLEPGRSSTVGSRPAFNSLQTVVRDTPIAAAVC